MMSDHERADPEKREKLFKVHQKVSLTAPDVERQAIRAMGGVLDA